MFSGTFKVTLQESFVQSILGITDEALLILGISIILFGIFFIGLSNYLQRITKPISTQKEVVRERFKPPEEFQDETINNYKILGKSKDILCHVCGNKSDGFYCEECGTQLKEFR